MLSLIPALLLLAFHGPGAVERFAQGGKLPEALRALERVWTPIEENEDGTGDEGRIARKRQVFASLAALTADPQFSKAVSELFDVPEEWLESSEPPARRNLPEAHAICAPHGESAVESGFASCRRTRDGPVA